MRAFVILNGVLIAAACIGAVLYLLGLRPFGIGS